MATPLCKAQVVLDRAGNLPEDQVVNSWHFEGDESSIGETDRERWDVLAPGLTDRLVVFYQTVDQYLGSVLAGTGRVKLYDMRDPKPRIPRLETEFVITPSPTCLPAEVALCLSFEAAKVPGTNAARRRGRVYLGPLSETVMTTDGADVRTSNVPRGAMLDAAQVMATGAAETFRLAIYSPTADTLQNNADDAWNDAVTLWMDDAFDTQRRRGAAPTNRITVAI